jgi:glucose-6-phosphate 1-dehydrogenase
MNGMPTILVLVGITGDLARRKLLPAIEGLRAAGALPEKFELVGVTRRENTEGYFVMDLDDSQGYERLTAYLSAIEAQWGEPAQRLFYLSVAPSVSLPIVQHLGSSGLARIPHTKLLIEKPFGTSFDDAKQTIETINQHFAPEQQYRIDHYLAKGSVRGRGSHQPHRCVVKGLE